MLFYWNLLQQHWCHCQYEFCFNYCSHNWLWLENVFVEKESAITAESSVTLFTLLNFLFHKQFLCISLRLEVVDCLQPEVLIVLRLDVFVLAPNIGHSWVAWCMVTSDGMAHDRSGDNDQLWVATASGLEVNALRAKGFRRKMKWDEMLSFRPLLYLMWLN